MEAEAPTAEGVRGQLWNPQALARRERRSVVDAVHGRRLHRLRGPDAYRLGDVSRRVLGSLGLAFPITDRRVGRAQQLLGPRYAEVVRSGLVGVLVADGLCPVPTVRERLLRSNDPKKLCAFDHALAEFASTPPTPARPSSTGSRPMC